MSLFVAGVNGIGHDKTAEALTGSVSLSALPAGVYVVKAVANDGTQTTLKIVK